MMRKKRKKAIRYEHNSLFNHVFKSKDRIDYMSRFGDVLDSVVLELDKRINHANTISIHVKAQIIDDIMMDVVYIHDHLNSVEIVYNQPKLDVYGIFAILRYKRPEYFKLSEIVQIMQN
jgi:hypothetical protein